MAMVILLFLTEMNLNWFCTNICTTLQTIYSCKITVKNPVFVFALDQLLFARHIVSKNKTLSRALIFNGKIS